MSTRHSSRLMADEEQKSAPEIDAATSQLWCVSLLIASHSAEAAAYNMGIEVYLARAEHTVLPPVGTRRKRSSWRHRWDRLLGTHTSTCIIIHLYHQLSTCNNLLLVVLA
jgi:hypothetical protein